MRTPLEQIKAILSDNLWQWVSEQFQPNYQSMVNRRYEDFISVTPTDVEQYILAHGFDPEGHIFESDDPSFWQTLTAPEGWYLIKNGQTWEVFWKERLQPLGVERFPTREDAVHHLVNEMMSASKASLDNWFRNAHLYYPPPLDPPVEGAGFPVVPR
jgi:hypothetical protein